MKGDEEQAAVWLESTPIDKTCSNQRCKRKTKVWEIRAEYCGRTPRHRLCGACIRRSVMPTEGCCPVCEEIEGRRMIASATGRKRSSLGVGVGALVNVGYGDNVNVTDGGGALCSAAGSLLGLQTSPQVVAKRTKFVKTRQLQQQQQPEAQQMQQFNQYNSQQLPPTQQQILNVAPGQEGRVEEPPSEYIMPSPHSSATSSPNLEEGETGQAESQLGNPLGVSSTTTTSVTSKNSPPSPANILTAPQNSINATAPPSHLTSPPPKAQLDRMVNAELEAVVRVQDILSPDATCPVCGHSFHGSSAQNPPALWISNCLHLLCTRGHQIDADIL
ncbi:hypothetical protein Pelo_15819 [Pelomyxa schiedti]|nr:hypothetical protein Pelo_15819 [Pelomyxa schiedti]